MTYGQKLPKAGMALPVPVRSRILSGTRQKRQKNLVSDFFYELSEEADADLEEIFDYTEQEYGIDQAVHYVSAFEDTFEQLVESPRIGRNRKEIRIGLRSMLKDQHVVFYRVLKDRIRIVRVASRLSRFPPVFIDWLPLKNKDPRFSCLS